uniref:Uncharacterized protein n=1 Tax=Solanum lycopersicum TaxID=4081 RepID=A0A3Q7G1Z7_SOLLC
MTIRIYKGHQRVDMLKELSFLSDVLVCSKRLVTFVRYVVPKLAIVIFPWTVIFSPMVSLVWTRLCKGSSQGTTLHQITISTINKSRLIEKLKALEILKKIVEKEAQMMNNNAFPFQTLGSAWNPPNCAS